MNAQKRKPSKPGKKKGKEPEPKQGLVQSLNAFFSGKEKFFLFLGLFLTALISFLLFQARVSIGGDDSAYIKRAYDLIHYGEFPSFQGPLYPMVLSLGVAAFGVNLTALKIFSGIFLLVHLYLFYLAYKNRIAALPFVFVLVIISIGAHLLTYASLTFSEAFFMMLQAGFIYYFFRKFIDSPPAENIKYDYKRYLILGLLALLMGLTRHIGYGALIAVLVYFAFEKKWRSIGYTIVSFSAFYSIVSAIKKVFFNASGIQFSQQLNSLLMKDYYNKSEGKEDFVGMLERFWDNVNLYISRDLLQYIGFRGDQAEVSSLLSIIVLALFLAVIIYIYRKNKYLFFTGVYVAILSGITFFIIQARWDQERLILVYIPMILLFLLGGLYEFSLNPKFRVVQVLFPGLLVIMFFTTLKETSTQVRDHRDELVHYLKGDKLYGLTPDWKNYIKMSQYAAKNVPEGMNIASRKPGISFIYTGREFTGIYRVPSEDPDELLNELKSKEAHYIVMASLRKYPQRKTKYTINTIQRYLYYIQQKYPDKIRPLHRIGEDEYAYLFYLDY